jgi:hexosaminidase
MWTEFTPPENLDIMLLPRLLALSETLWSPKSSLDYTDFLERARAHYPLLKTLGVTVGPETEPWYMKYKYQLRMSKLFLTIFREDRETAIENFRHFSESSE